MRSIAVEQHLATLVLLLQLRLEAHCLKGALHHLWQVDGVPLKVSVTTQSPT